MSDKLENAIAYLRNRKIYRGDVDQSHQYTPYEPYKKEPYLIVETTGSRVETLNHVEKNNLIQLSR